MASIFRKPEIAARYGAIDDEAFTDGSETDAALLRELARSGGNQIISRGGFMFRAAYDPRSSSDTEGVASSFAPPYWQHLIPCPAVPVSKKYGIEEMRVRLRINVTNNRTIAFYVGTIERPSPNQVPLAQTFKILGTGVTDAHDFLVPVRKAKDEILSFYIRGMIDPTSDSLMATATYGINNTGLVDRSTMYTFGDDSSNWNVPGGGATVDSGGHYVYFTNSLSTTPLHVAKVHSVVYPWDLSFWPGTHREQSLDRSTYTIRTLPAVRLVSIACYGVDRVAA